MSAEELHRLLARLHTQLQGSPELDAESRQLLQEIGADLGRLGQGATAGANAGALPGATAPAGEHASRLEALVGRFEGAHPSLAASLREIVDALGRAGL
jgi:hypothetical protein